MYANYLKSLTLIFKINIIVNKSEYNNMEEKCV